MGFKNLVALGNDRLTCRKLNCVVRIMLYDNGVNKGMICAVQNRELGVFQNAARWPGSCISSNTNFRQIRCVNQPSKV
jgi:hypothetical protein